MSRWLPSPGLSLALLGGWLLLARSFGPGHWLLGALLALVLPLLMRPLRPTPGRLRRLRMLARLILRVGRDVLKSALQVAVGVLRARTQPPRGRFVRVPLELREVHAVAALAIITTVVPGTVWSELAPDRSALLLHVFDVDDEVDFVAHFKADYERPLREIFE